MIREATPADLPRLFAIRTVALPDSSRRLLEYGVRGPMCSLVATERHAAAAPRGEGDLQWEVAGYALATSAEDGTAYLSELAVAPASRRRGHGRDLVEAVATRLTDHGGLRVTTPADDDRARAFYQALGFTTVRPLPGHYDGEEGVLLERTG